MLLSPVVRKAAVLLETVWFWPDLGGILAQ